MGLYDRIEVQSNRVRIPVHASIQPVIVTVSLKDRCGLRRSLDISLSRSRGILLCDPAQRQSNPIRQDRAPAYPSRRASAEAAGYPVPERSLSGGQLENPSQGRCQSRMAYRRTVSESRLHRDKSSVEIQQRGSILQQARYGRAVDQRGQICLKLDTAVLS